MANTNEELRKRLEKQGYRSETTDRIINLYMGNHHKRKSLGKTVKSTILLNSKGRGEMKAKLRMKCSKCGHWNRIEVNKFFMEQETHEPKAKTFVPMYEPVKIETCKKCKNVIAQPKELIRIIHKESDLDEQKR